MSLSPWHQFRYAKSMRWVFILMLTTLKIWQHRSLPSPVHGFITVSASEKYSSPSLLEKIFFGSNYRQEWETPVTMPVFDIRKTNFRIVQMGGGHQTTSLELIDEYDREWVLRSVDKDVRLESNATDNKFVKAVVQDQISGAYPYVGLSIPDITRAAGVQCGEQRLYFVADDSSFGEHRLVLANKVFILVNTQPHLQKGITTGEMLEKLKLDQQYYVDPRIYLKARLVDWLIADWDRHMDQWRWIEKKTDSGFVFYAVPRDRDQAFFKTNGLLGRLVGLFFMPHTNKFNQSGRGIKGLSKKMKDMDKQFLDRLTKEEWESIIKEFQNNVSDSVIESAVKKQPPEIFNIRGKELIEKLRSRRDGLFRHVMKYYSFLQKLEPTELKYSDTD